MTAQKTDEQLQAEVITALQRDLWFPAAHIGVSANSGAVTLSGETSSEQERLAATEAAQSVVGVLAVADEIRVRSSSERERTDTDVAVDVAAALGRLVIDGHVSADVIDHVVVLDGEVRQSLVREEAEAAVSAIHGVLNVVNRISIGPPAAREDVERQIVEAFTQRATRRAEAIVVEADDGHVVLRGNIGGLSERSLAEQAAWATPGVRSVKNHLHVQPS